MRFILIAVLAFIFPASVIGQLAQDELEAIADHQRHVLKLEETANRIKKGDVSPRKITIVWSILQQTGETSSHQLGGATDNTYFLHEDGHKEIVYDANKQVVKDGINDGSYNYFPAACSPLRHFTYDTMPWIELGHSKKDRHSRNERIDAFCADLFVGVIRALEKGLPDKMIRFDDLTEPGQAVSLAAMLDAIKLGGGEDLFDYFDDGNDFSERESQREIVFTIKQKVAPGFKRLYQRYPKKARPGDAKVVARTKPVTASVPISKLREVDYELIKIRGVQLGLASHFEKLGEAGNDSRWVLIFTSPPNLKDLSHAEGVLRVKLVSKENDYSFTSELDKLEAEWLEFHNVKLSTTLKEIYRKHPLEERTGNFHAEVAYIARAGIPGNPNDFVLFTYAAESETQTLLLTLFSPSSKMSKAGFEKNKLAFDLLMATAK